MSAANSYIARKYHDKSDVNILIDSIKIKQNILLLGPRGTGKSSLAAEVAKRMGREYCYIPCHTGATPEALIGQWIPNPSGSGYVWMDGVLTRAVRHGKICLLDEVNSLKPEVAFAIHGLLDHRRELVLTDKPGPDGGPEVVTAHKNFGLIAAGNPFYEGVRVLNEAFRDRFAVQLFLGYNADLDIAVIRGSPSVAKMEPKMAAAMEKFIQKIRSAVKNKAVKTEISTRAFLDFADTLVAHTFDVAVTLFVTRYSDDPAEITAIRTCFHDVWDNNGKPIGVTDKEAEDVLKGRAGRLGAKVNPIGKDAF